MNQNFFKQSIIYQNKWVLTKCNCKSWNKWFAITNDNEITTTITATKKEIESIVKY